MRLLARYVRRKLLEEVSVPDDGHGRGAAERQRPASPGQVLQREQVDAWNKKETECF